MTGQGLDLVRLFFNLLPQRVDWAAAASGLAEFVIDGKQGGFQKGLLRGLPPYMYTLGGRDWAAAASGLAEFVIDST